MPVDVLVGQNIRICRLQKGLSQGELGQQIGVTFQQVQKYEKGANRVGASRLNQIANVLGVPLRRRPDRDRGRVGSFTALSSVQAAFAAPAAGLRENRQ
jgi:transcriptional regulator with XRE-family HTH domain